MNKKESTFSTTGSISEGKESPKVCDQKTLALLKLVYYERKSIKQSSKYLKINYNSAKRIIKTFRRGRLPIEDQNEESYETFIRELKAKTESRNLPKCETPQKIEKKQINRVETPSHITNLMAEQIRLYNNQLISLNEEIRQNQMTLIYLTNCAFKMYLDVKRV